MGNTKIHPSHKMNECGVCSLCNHTSLSDGIIRRCAERLRMDIRDSRRGGKDWKGEPVPDNEPDDAVISVWKISPSFQDAFDYTIIRGWQEMLTFVNSGIELVLDDKDEEALIEEGATVEIKLIKMKLGEYLDLPED